MVEVGLGMSGPMLLNEEWLSYHFCCGRSCGIDLVGGVGS